jgi:hypothetical protein
MTPIHILFAKTLVENVSHVIKIYVFTRCFDITGHLQVIFLASSRIFAVVFRTYRQAGTSDIQSKNKMELKFGTGFFYLIPEHTRYNKDKASPVTNE